MLSSDLAAIKIWNYNKSVRDSTKGVREIEVFLNGENKFGGVVKMGRGQVNEDYSQLIAIQDDVQIEPESVQGVAEISDVRNEKAIEVSAGLGNISFSRQADAHQDQELQYPAS